MNFWLINMLLYILKLNLKIFLESLKMREILSILIIIRCFIVLVQIQEASFAVTKLPTTANIRPSGDDSNLDDEDSYLNGENENGRIQRHCQCPKPALVFHRNLSSGEWIMIFNRSSPSHHSVPAQVNLNRLDILTILIAIA